MYDLYNDNIPEGIDKYNIEDIIIYRIAFSSKILEYT